MRQPSESGNRVQGTPTTSYTRLTKAELLAIIENRGTQQALTYEEFYRCAIAAVANWCHRVRNNSFTCTDSVKATLDSLQHIYKNL